MKLNINGNSVLLIDTAGLRQTEDEIEKMGIKKAIDIALKSDLILYLLSSDQLKFAEGKGFEITEDAEILEILKFEKRCLFVVNKADLIDYSADSIEIKVKDQVIKANCISILEKSGISEL